MIPSMVTLLLVQNKCCGQTWWQMPSIDLTQINPSKQKIIQGKSFPSNSMVSEKIIILNYERDGLQLQSNVNGLQLNGYSNIFAKL